MTDIKHDLMLKCLFGRGDLHWKQYNNNSQAGNDKLIPVGHDYNYYPFLLKLG